MASKKNPLEIKISLHKTKAKELMDKLTAVGFELPKGSKILMAVTGKQAVLTIQVSEATYETVLRVVLGYSMLLSAVTNIDVEAFEKPKIDFNGVGLL
jgi:hypothetical protein